MFLSVWIAKSQSKEKQTDLKVRLEEYRWHTGRKPFKAYKSKRDKLLATLLPERIQKRFFPDIEYRTLDSGFAPGNEFAFTAFFKFEGDKPIPYLRFVVGSESGEQFDYADQTHIHSEVNRYIAFRTSNLPRRKNSLLLRLVVYERGEGDKVVAEFKVRNPAYGDYPVWETEPLPVRASDEVLSGELTDFTIRRSGVGKRSLFIREWSEMNLTLSESGDRTVDWKIDHLEILDATGNHVQIPFHDEGGRIRGSGMTEARWDEDELRIRIDEILWDGEEAWKLRAAFVRKSDPSDSQTLEFLAKPEVIFLDRE